MHKGRRPLNIIVGSWDEALRVAESEYRRTGKPYYAIEYQEKDSTDGMKFFEACIPYGAEMLREHYVITNLQLFQLEP